MKTVSYPSGKNPELEKILNRGLSPSPQIEKTVKNILTGIKNRGHKAVMENARRFDGLKGTIKVGPEELKKASIKCPAPLKAAVNKSISNVKDFHQRQRESSWTFKAKDDVTLGQTLRPLKRVGVYVPGGKGIYPSTAIMNIVPAQVAGVPEIVVVTPTFGSLSAIVAYTLTQLKVKEIYKVGGAQAVGMLAYGTEKVERVDKIVGPGNVYAAVAKKEVFGLVDIDMVAGPSEILVLADEKAEADWVAADLLSQAEHGSGYEAAICITTSEKMAHWISLCVKEQVNKSPKKDLVKKCLNRFGRIFLVKNWKTGIELANLIAPEHLEIMTTNADSLAKQIVNAGAVFVGPYSSEPIGDYFAGPNHVLPTNGSARFFSPLGVYDFYKRTSYIRYSEKAIKKNGKTVVELAEAEGFYHHAEAVRKRI